MDKTCDACEFLKYPTNQILITDYWNVGTLAPDDLRTRISPHPVEQNPQDDLRYSPQESYVEGYNIAATVVVDFDSRKTGRRMLNLDFVKTEDGLRLMQRDEGDVMQYSREITETEMAALGRDAMASKELIVEEAAELIRLGPLVEDQAEDGTRRFHIGDILAITTGRLVSPRGMDGIYDILGFMTNDSPYTTQLGRFSKECSPALKEQLGEALKSYSEVPERVKDRLSLYKWLHEVTDEMSGDPFLKVTKIGEDYHAVIDPVTELELDHGPEILKKVISVDPKSSEKDD